MYADFEYYNTTYMGNSISEADFPRLALRAGEYIDYMTMGKAAYSTSEAIQKCCCALAEQIQISEKGANDKQSESVGDYSVTYKSDISAMAQAEMANIVRRYLLATGLLYRGNKRCMHHIP